MKLYQRISTNYVPGDGAIADDDNASIIFNKKLELFLNKNKVKSYRILNVETTIIPEAGFGGEYNMLSMHIEYEK